MWTATSCTGSFRPWTTTTGRMGIYQRDLEAFSERPVIENQNFSVGWDGCMNCHSFRRNRPDRMSLQIRSASVGRPMVVIKDGVPQTVDTAASGFSKSPAAYQAWHPDGRHIAYSVNKVMPLEHTTRRAPRRVG